jgi:ribosomal protein S18 acetylase RimI-like enzyme
MRDASDVVRMLDLVRARPPQRATDYPTVTDLPGILAVPQNLAGLRLWFYDGERLCAFALVDSFATLRCEIDWRVSTPELEAAVVIWGLERRRQQAGPGTQLYASCHESDLGCHAFLLRHGFAPLDEHILHMARPLAAPVSARPLPPGYTLRRSGGLAEAGDLAALHRAAFGTPHMTPERMQTAMRSPSYNPATDLVAVAPDGRLAAYARATVNHEDNQLSGRSDCATDLFATHPSHRGRHLARALLAELLRLLQPSGYSRAVLSTSSANLAMQRVATDQGFRVDGRTLRFSRKA